MARPEYAGLLESLTRDEAMHALAVLLGLGDPAARWALEAVAIAAPDKAVRARALKGDPLREALDGIARGGRRRRGGTDA